jgi:hypothetical protein
VTAPNHALTGALIGLSISNPLLALPLAFLSHFLCDAIPHYDRPEQDSALRIGSKRLFYELVVIGALGCFLVVLYLTLVQPMHWVSAAVCAFLAASPDLFWMPRFFHVRKTGKDIPLTNPFLRFHDWIQWKTGPKLIIVELIWAAVAIWLLVAHF